MCSKDKYTLITDFPWYELNILYFNYRFSVVYCTVVYTYYYMCILIRVLIRIFIGTYMSAFIHIIVYYITYCTIAAINVYLYVCSFSLCLSHSFSLLFSPYFRLIFPLYLSRYISVLIQLSVTPGCQYYTTLAVQYIEMGIRVESVRGYLVEACLGMIYNIKYTILVLYTRMYTVYTYVYCVNVCILCLRIYTVYTVYV